MMNPIGSSSISQSLSSSMLAVLRIPFLLMMMMMIVSPYTIEAKDISDNFGTFTATTRREIQRILQQTQPTTTAAPVQVPAPAVAVTTTGNPTSSPTISAPPTYEEKCYVCNGDANQYVSLVTTEIKFFTETVTCVALEVVGRSGLLPPSTCPVAQKTVNETCGCQVGKPDYNTSVAFPTGSPTVTIPPTVNQDTPVDCYLCGSVDRYIANRTADVDILGKKVNCNELDIAARNRYLTQPVCLVASQFVSVNCGCSDTAAPSTISTITPTVTSAPTATATPTFVDKCYICGSQSKQIDTTKNETIIIKGVVQTCFNAQKFSLMGFTDDTMCAAIQEQITTKNSCTCIPGTTPTTTGSSPPQISPPTSPSSSTTTTSVPVTVSAPVVAPTSSAPAFTIFDRTIVFLKLISPICIITFWMMKEILL